MTLTAATVKRDFLDPALDARSANLLQARLVYNPDTPEPDSILELFQWLLRERPDLLDDREIAEKAADALQCIRRIVATNQLEGHDEKRIAGKADALVTHLRHAQLNGDRPGVPLRRVIRVARSIVGAIVRGEAATVDDFAQFRWLVLSVPASHLLTSSVEHDLGRKRFELWRRIVSNESGVQAGIPDPASHSGAPPDDLAEA